MHNHLNLYTTLYLFVLILFCFPTTGNCEIRVQIGDDIDGEAEYDESGYSVSLSADGFIVAIGARYNDGNGEDSGHVRVFKVRNNVYYFGNTNTGGAVPVDTSIYNAGDTVTVLCNSGTLVRTNHTFEGWNTSADGSGTSYNYGDTFIMGNNDIIILYAQWIPFSFSGGDGSEDNPYQIAMLDDMLKLAEYVNIGNDFDGTYFKLMNDIAIPEDHNIENGG